MTKADWIAKLGELYGSPFKKSDGGWGIAVYLTEQQEDVVRERHRACCDEERYGEDYLEGAIAVSVDKNGNERKLTITDGSRWQMQSDWNGNRTQKCDARSRTPQEDHDARWDPPEPSAAARRKGAEAMAAAKNADEPDEALDKFIASLKKRKTNAGRATAETDRTELEPDPEQHPQTRSAKTGNERANDTDTEPSPTKGARPTSPTHEPSPTAEDGVAGARTKLGNTAIAASIADYDAWTSWKKAVGELRGKPTKLESGWGIEITLTPDQEKLIEARRNAVDNAPSLGIDDVLAFDHLRDMDAVSVDRSGRERKVTIVDSNTYGSRYDYDGNTVWTCTTKPRQPDRYQPTKPVVRGADRPVGSGPGNARQPRRHDHKLSR